MKSKYSFDIRINIVYIKNNFDYLRKDYLLNKLHTSIHNIDVKPPVIVGYINSGNVAFLK